MTQIATEQHNWVKHVITPVEVLADDEGQPVVLVDPEKQTDSEEEAVYGCLNCGEPLHGNLGSKCEGEDG